MSIIVLTPKPKPGTLSALATDNSPSLTSEFLGLVGLHGFRFDSFEELRDFALAQIAADQPPADSEPVGPVDPAPNA